MYHTTIASKWRDSSLILPCSKIQCNPKSNLFHPFFTLSNSSSTFSQRFTISTQLFLLFARPLLYYSVVFFSIDFHTVTSRGVQVESLNLTVHIFALFRKVSFATKITYSAQLSGNLQGEKKTHFHTLFFSRFEHGTAHTTHGGHFLVSSTLVSIFTHWVFYLCRCCWLFSVAAATSLRSVCSVRQLHIIDGTVYSF